MNYSVLQKTKKSLELKRKKMDGLFEKIESSSSSNDLELAYELSSTKSKEWKGMKKVVKNRESREFHHQLIISWPLLSLIS